MLDKYACMMYNHIRKAVNEMRNARIMKKYYKKHPVCEICGSPTEVVHHKVPIVMGGLNSEENLISVCSHCHKELHKNEYTISELTKIGQEKAKKKEVTALISLEEALYEINAQECITAVEAVEVLLSLRHRGSIESEKIRVNDI